MTRANFAKTVIFQGLLGPIFLLAAATGSAQEVKRSTGLPATSVAPAKAAVPARAAGAPTRPVDSSDVLGEWLEQNAELFDLYMDESDVPQKPTGNEPFGSVPVTPVRVKVEKKTFTPPPAAIATSDAATQIKAVMDDLKFKGTCDQFATEKGFGPWGRVVIDALKRGHGEALLEGPDDLLEHCPNYKNLGVEERSYVWVNIFAMMAFKESTCRPGARRPGIAAGRWARGILQLHEDKENTYSKSCKRGASRSPGETLRCGIVMLNNQVQETGRLFYKRTYWGVLRPQGDLKKDPKTGRARRVDLTKLTKGSLKELPLCQRSTRAVAKK